MLIKLYLVAQLLEMLERNELNKALLTLLDENIASAHRSNQVGNIKKINSLPCQDMIFHHIH